MKDVVFMMDIKMGEDSQRYTPNRSLPYQYSISSWKKFCDRYDCELVILDELLYPADEMAICWQRYHLFDILESSGIDYNQVLVVDADTIVHPDCPNIFEMTDNKFTVATLDASWDWVSRSVENYSLFVFDNYKFDVFKYFDCGFYIVNSQHKKFFKFILEFYNENVENLKWMQETFHTGTDQTPVNFLTEMYNIEKTYLPYEYNMVDLLRKELLSPTNDLLAQENDLLFTKIGMIYQFNCIPLQKDNEVTFYYMKRTYNELYGELEGDTTVVEIIEEKDETE